jgi:transcriptional regulator of heat shock response
MTRKNDHQYRKDLVLGIVVNEYIKTINPVSSGFIAQEYLSNLSSATIRNILAELEENGFLTHPHTSAGRIPTQEGYRYYVDHLMQEIQLLEEEKFRIKKEYEQNVRNLEIVLDKTSEVISDLTHYTSIVSVDGWDRRIFCKGTSFVVGYQDYPDIEKIRNILKALEEKGHLLELINRNLEQKMKIYIGHEMAWANMEGCSLAVSRYHTGKGPSGSIAVLGPLHMNYQRVVSTLEYLSSVIEEVL